jgi:hypothetical protein
MKVNIAKYLTFIGVCQQVKAEHKRPAVFLSLKRIHSGTGSTSL